MAWRDTMVLHFGPGMLGGITMSNWFRLLRDNRFAVSPSCFLRASAISTQSIRNSVLGWYEDRKYGSVVKDTPVKPPLFLLGHWRSGTTHLHNLVTTDERFAFPNNYQVFFPHIFLCTEKGSAGLVGFFFPRQRPMDNIQWTIHSPQEDEFALAVTSFMSPCLGWVFPHRLDHYGQYLTFREASAGDIAKWQAELVDFLKKLTVKYGRPLVLKSPPHTCRIRLLLQMFPDAKFVHIHRDPYAVFQSSRKVFQVSFKHHRLQRLPKMDLDEWILRQYREMYDAFFEERGLIPKGNYHEVGFEALEADPLGEMRRMYEVLSLPDFEETKPALTRYVESIAGYKKNEFPNLDPDLRSRIASRWQPSFLEWGYPV